MENARSRHFHLPCELRERNLHFNLDRVLAKIENVI
jgi:hypothetical protein